MKIEDAQDNAVIFGSGDHNAEKIREAFGSDIVQRGDELIIRGGDTEKAKSAVLDFLWILDRQEDLDAQKTEYVLELNKEGQTYRKSNVKSDIICFTHRGRPIRAKTLGQIAYADNIRHNDIVFGIGPAGTGKTYLAVAMAVHAFKNKEVEKIILARPAVEAGESLGFLPGDLQEKVDPYLRPLYFDDRKRGVLCENEEVRQFLFGDGHGDRDASHGLRSRAGKRYSGHRCRSVVVQCRKPCYRGSE